jgi:ankyrin repeat protein
MNIDDCNTTLMFAVEKGYYSIVKLLIANGADVNHRSMRYVWGDDCPLVSALNYKHHEIVKLLLEYGAVVPRNVLNFIPCIPLKTLKILVEYGADIYSMSEDTKNFIEDEFLFRRFLNFFTELGMNDFSPPVELDRELFTESQISEKGFWNLVASFIVETSVS